MHFPLPCISLYRIMVIHIPKHRGYRGWIGQLKNFSSGDLIQVVRIKMQLGAELL